MAARTFTDSAGLTWDVFEVHRASKKPGAVSAGLEEGWLAFACGEQKRRLAPFPPDWASLPDVDLAVLCEAARRAPAPRYPLHEPLRPRIRRSVKPAVEAPATALGDDVQTTVRDFAREARTRGLPAVAAMLELKTLLLERHPQADSEARDRKAVRRWFVEAYYFDRNR
ncbi:MAG TPA: hypothetical protein VFP15_06095 [Gemmatimonadaceae bacterium]|nr:hypothetical protein [Gemmatimonadaceae bacterium]